MPRRGRRAVRWARRRDRSGPARTARQRAGGGGPRSGPAGHREPVARRPATADRSLTRRLRPRVAAGGPALGGAFALAAPRLLGGAAGDAEVVHVVRILDQTIVDVVTDLLARGTDEIDALDGLVDPLAVQDPSLELLDADAEELLVLPLDLATPGLVLRKFLFRLVAGLLVVIDGGGVRLGLRPGALIALARACHCRLPASLGACVQRVRRV